MARKFTPPVKTPRTGDTDLEFRVHFEKPEDPENVVPDDMKFQLSLKWTDGTGGSPTINVAKALNVADLAHFRRISALLRDRALDAAGALEV